VEKDVRGISLHWWSVLEISLGVVAGGLLNWLFTRQSSRELRREAERLRRHTTLILRALEEAVKAGNVEFARDEQGEIISDNRRGGGSENERQAGKG
jgi:hypothetical protein